MTKSRRIRPATARGRYRSAFLPAIGLLFAVTLTACGSDGGDGDGEDVSAAGQDGGSAAEDGGEDDELLEFYACLRDQGFDVPDPDPNQNGIRLDPREMGLDNPEGMAALEECEDLLPGGGPGGESEQMDADGMAAMREFTQCLRDNGIDMADPGSDGSLAVPEGVDPNSSEFQSAVEECQHLTAGNGISIRGGR